MRRSYSIFRPPSLWATRPRRRTFETSALLERLRTWPWWARRRSGRSCTRRSGGSPTICAAASTAGTSRRYVLGTLFYRFISENLTAYLNEQERKAGSPDFDYAALSDAEAERGRRETVAEKGFYILPSELFANVRERARHDENLNETLAKVFRDIEGSAVGDGERGRHQGPVRRPRRQLEQARPDGGEAQREARQAARRDRRPRPRRYADNTIDAFGDAYEFLMTMYASSAGKSGGEFFTPQEVSELLARITVVGKTEVNKVYDPACGSGSLLLKFAKVLGRDNVRLGLLRPGDQPHDLQPVPDQHVPARRQLREVRHRPRRHADRPAALGRRAVRGDRLQPALLDQVGRATRTRC